MNILHINDKIEISGGVETNIQQLCEFSSDFGVQTQWIGIYKEDAYQIKWFKDAGTNLSDARLDEVLNFLSKTVKKKEIDIIHIHSLSNPEIIRHCFQISKVVRSMHEPRIVCPGQGKFWRNSERICNQPFGLHCIYHAFKEGCVNRHPKRLINAYKNVAFETTEGKENYAAIFAMSQYMVDEALKVGYTKEQLVYNPYFTAIVEEENLKDQTHSNTKSIIFVGRLSKTKGVHYFIECGLQLLEKDYDIQLDIVGDGHDAAYFKSLVPEEFKDKFTFHGWQSRDQIDDLINQSYLMVFPSIYPEAFGISGIEAMMRGKPVVGFDVGGVSTWLKDNKTGHLVPVKDTEAMQEKIATLIKNKEQYKKFSQNARTIALEEFSVKRHMNTLVVTYKRIKNY